MGYEAQARGKRIGGSSDRNPSSTRSFAAFKLSGTLTGDDIDLAIADLDARLKRHDKIGIVADMTAFHDVGLRAALKDLRYSFGKLLDWKRFPREAVIADKSWIKMMIGLAGPIIPCVNIRVFTPGQDDDALAWAGNFDSGVKEGVV